MKWMFVTLLTSALALLGGCGSGNTASDAATEGCILGCLEECAEEPPCKVTVNWWTTDASNNVDMLFVIDVAEGMAEEQASLRQSFSSFVNVLSSLENGLPSVHIGVISSQLTTPESVGWGCVPFTDGDGTLQNSPRDPGCTPPADRYIIDVQGDDGTRVTNYEGDLADTFGCVAQLGVSGCPYRQPLEAMRRALDGSNALNDGFLRDDAFLSVIFLTTGDDCSVAAELADFGSAEASVDHRCFEAGVACDPDTPRVEGAKNNCVPREDSEDLHDVPGYIDFLQTLKEDPTMVIVGGIIGNPAPVSVVTDMDGNLDLGPSCSSASGTANPSVRMKTFLDAFPQRNTITTICNEDLSDAFVVIAELFRKVVGSRCLDGDIRDTDDAIAGIQPDCQVYEIRRPAIDQVVVTELPECVPPDSSATNQPCWLIQHHPEACSSGSGLEVELFPESTSYTREIAARCTVNSLPEPAADSADAGMASP